MAYYQNLQISKQRVQSKYPFDDSSTLMLGGHTFPGSWIVSLNLIVTTGLFPLYVSRVSFADQTVIMDITDGNGNTNLFIRLYTEDACVVDGDGRSAGSILVQPQLFPWLQRLVRDTFYGTIILPSTALILSSEVITCAYFKGYSGVQCNNTVTGPKVILNFQRNVKVTRGDADKDISLNIYGDYAYSYQNTNKLQQINSLDLRNKSLIIKHKKLADLRVVTANKTITLTGVTDVT